MKDPRRPKCHLRMLLIYSKILWTESNYIWYRYPGKLVHKHNHGKHVNYCLQKKSLYKMNICYTNCWNRSSHFTEETICKINKYKQKRGRKHRNAWDKKDITCCLILNNLRTKQLIQISDQQAILSIGSTFIIRGYSIR